MKIEKITKNKIRIILKQQDFKDKNINLQKTFLNSNNSQKLLLEILNKAEKELKFETTGYKLLVESFFEENNTCILTITKFLESKNNTDIKKKLKLRKISENLENNLIIYEFDEFENFCNFCDSFFNTTKNTNYNEIKNTFKKSQLYFYNNTYYLILNKKINNLNYVRATSLLQEFATIKKYSKNFKSKLTEHGKLLIKSNAIYTGIKHFSN